MIDFKNTLILLTTNAGTEMIASLCADPELMPEPEAIRQVAARTAAEDLPAGAARPPGDHPLLPAQRRHAQGHFAPATGADQEARGGDPQGAVVVVTRASST